MKILFFKSLSSTQSYLKELLKKQEEELPLAVVADMQTAGIGSRNNSWNSKEGNLFLSFALAFENIPDDLKFESASIYYAYLLKETLHSFGSKVFLKWPNDLYIGDSKVGGMITNIIGKTLVCGVGVNLEKRDDIFGILDIQVEKKVLLERYFQNIEKRVLWKQVFRKFKLEFQTNQKFFTHVSGKKVSLSEAELQNDGSLLINGQKVYSLR